LVVDLPIVRVLLGALIATALTACTATEQAKDVQKSGFLFDYTRLRPGRQETDPQLMFVSPDADFATYDAILLEPVSIWVRPEEGVVRVDHAGLQELANIFHSALAEKLAQDYRMVQERGPGVLRLRVALTEAEQSSVGLDIASMIIPLGTWTSKMTSGTHSFVGRAGIEAEATDSMSGKVLYAAVDRRVGGKSFTGSTDSWDDVHQAFNYWSDRAIARIRELRSRPSTEKR
jgi:hypothetical protein